MRIPQLRRHKTKRLAYARFKGKQVYFGPWPDGGKPTPPETYDKFQQYLAKWLQSQKAGNPPLLQRTPTIKELWAAYLEHCESEYVKNGKPTSEVNTITCACRIVARLYGNELADEFGPLKLKAVRSQMIDKGWCRGHVNKQVMRVKKMFSWAVANELLPDAVFRSLEHVKGLRKGKAAAPEGKKVLPVNWELVENTLPYLDDPLPDMVRVHYLLGCRAQDLCRMRAGDIDRSGEMWLYVPDSHKNEHHDLELAYWIGPEAQIVLASHLTGKPNEAFVFTTHGKKGNSKARPRDGAYRVGSYRQAVTRGCKRGKVERWFPLQLRHARLTEIRRKYGLEAAQAVARHTQMSTTEIYAQRIDEHARKVMREIG